MNGIAALAVKEAAAASGHGASQLRRRSRPAPSTGSRSRLACRTLLSGASYWTGTPRPERRPRPRQRPALGRGLRRVSAANPRQPAAMTRRLSWPRSASTPPAAAGRDRAGRAHRSPRLPPGRDQVADRRSRRRDGPPGASAPTLTANRGAGRHAAPVRRDRPDGEQAGAASDEQRVPQASRGYPWR